MAKLDNRTIRELSIAELHDMLKQGPSRSAMDELNRRKAAAKARKVGTIDLTPTWAGVLPILIAALENGTPEGKKLAKLEFANMAKAADLYNASVPR